MHFLVVQDWGFCEICIKMTTCIKTQFRMKNNLLGFSLFKPR